MGEPSTQRRCSVCGYALPESELVSGPARICALCRDWVDRDSRLRYRIQEEELAHEFGRDEDMGMEF